MGSYVVFLRSWLIVVGTLTIGGAFAGRNVLLHITSRNQLGRVLPLEPSAALQ
jgi:hypothetical protein